MAKRKNPITEWRGRRYYTVQGYWARFDKHPDGRTKTVLMHREVMEEALGRPLLTDEIVHHLDEDKKNNDPSNLEVTTASKHASHHSTRPTEKVVFTCPECGAVAEKLAREVRGNRKKGKLGPFCGRRCAGRANQRKSSRASVSCPPDESLVLELLGKGLSLRKIAELAKTNHTMVRKIRDRNKPK